MGSRPGLGLRSQLIIVLSVAFFLAFSLLAFAAVQLAERQKSNLNRQVADRWATTASLVALEVDFDTASERLSKIVEQPEVRGVRVQRSGDKTLEVGDCLSQPSATLKTKTAVVSVWIEPRESMLSTAIPLLLYGILTGIALLFAVYVLLTRMIVRPIADVRRAAERLESGNLKSKANVEGAAEVAELAMSFNRMATQLEEDRAALVERLADLESTTQELRSAQDQVIRTSRLAAVGQLAAGVAHEIGNPLTAMQGLLELVSTNKLTESENADYVTRAQNEGARIQRTIRDLLDFARDDGKDDRDPEAKANLHSVLNTTLRLVEPQKRFANVEFRSQISDAFPELAIPSDRLQQLLLNLFFNAADAMNGEGSIHIDAEMLGNGFAAIRVRDSGPGIAVEIQDRIFDPFITSKSAKQGTGLGLAVCHAIVDRVGGQITAANANDGGACFEVRIRVSSN